jgi:hypothetical protein
MQADMITHGRELVERGELRPRGMIDNLALCAYFQQQRDLVARRGSCASHCQSEQVEHLHGHLVCPHTWQPCPRKRLRLIVSHFSRIFSQT